MMIRMAGQHKPPCKRSQCYQPPGPPPAAPPANAAAVPLRARFIENLSLKRALSENLFFRPRKTEADKESQ
jgi:hypothetical protein